ncbi:MAG: hypothetical protein JWO06_1762 [Bacteroidota bacterium]|nr:hypothetical protein [Bacteroidota bacterium]
MQFIRKFYDAGKAETGTEAATETAPPSLASLMATGGKKTENSPIVYTKEPTENETKNIENQEKSKDETKIAETATSETETGKPEQQKQPEKAKEAPKPIVEEQLKQPTLQEVLKTVQPKAVFKAMGMDDDTVAIFEELSGYEQKQYFAALLKNIKEGKGNEYLREWNTDYAKMPAEEVMRHQLQRDYPKASAKQLDALFKKEIVEKYNLNSDDADELEEGNLLLGAIADKYRDDFVNNQKTFLTPKAPEPKAEVVDDEPAKRFEAYKLSIDNDPLTKEIESTGKITIGEGENAFKLPVKISSLKDILYNSDIWATKFFDVTENADGTKNYAPNIKKQMLVAAILDDDNSLLKGLENHYKSIGGKAAIDPLENAKPKDGDNYARSQKQPQTLAEAMAKSGTIKR